MLNWTVVVPTNVVNPAMLRICINGVYATPPILGKPIAVIPVELLLAVKLFFPACIKMVAPVVGCTYTWPATQGKSWYIKLAVVVVR